MFCLSSVRGGKSGLDTLKSEEALDNQTELIRRCVAFNVSYRST